MPTSHLGPDSWFQVVGWDIFVLGADNKNTLVLPQKSLEHFNMASGIARGRPGVARATPISLYGMSTHHFVTAYVCMDAGWTFSPRVF